MRLLGVELRRLTARIAVVIVMVVGLAATLLLGLAAYSSAQPMTEEQLAEAEKYYELDRQNWEENGEQMIADCLEAQEMDAEASGDDTLDYGCEEMEPQREWYIWEPPAFSEFTTAALPQALLLVSLVSLLVGVTFVAAEFATGSIGTWLTFVPQRGKVFTSKTTAAALAGLVFGLVWGAAYLGVTAAGYALAGSDVTITAPLIHSVLKVGVLALAVTMIGTALAFLLRHTAAALGVAIGYLIGIDAILLQALRGGGRWSLTNNLAAWVAGRASYYEESCTTDQNGTMCDYVERTITQTQGGLVLAVVVVFVTALALLTFRRRDV